MFLSMIDGAQALAHSNDDLFKLHSQGILSGYEW